MFTPERPVTNPFTKEELDTYEAYIGICRGHVNGILLKVMRDIPGASEATGEMAKAFNALNEAMMFLNVSYRHMEYSYNILDKGIDYANSEAGKFYDNTSPESLSEDVSDSTETKPDQGQGCKLQHE